jgi:4-hydroxy-4-methyl-2-oxoglutarate aldolase
MFTVNAMPSQLSPALVELLEKAEVATMGHFLYTGFADRAIRPLIRGRKVAGTAVTLRLPHADSTLLVYAVSRLRPGDIVVVDRCGDTKYACWGGALTLAMKLAGVKAGIIDGPATDLREIEEYDLPMWCRGIAPVTTRILGLEGAMNVPITIGGQVVHPGDAILADEQGVIVLEPARAQAAAECAVRMQQDEVDVLNRLRAGERFSDIVGVTDIVENGFTAVDGPGTSDCTSPQA